MFRNRVLLRPESLDRLEKAVAEAERHTSCEYVVVLAPASSRYEGRVWAIACALAVITFVVVHFINTQILYLVTDPPLLLLESLAVGGVAGLLFSRVGALKRLIVPLWRRTACVDIAAESTFTKENVGLTRDRNAVLLYISVLEGEVRLMPDIGLVRKLHEAKLGEIKAMLINAAKGDPVEVIEGALVALGKACGECFPRAADDVNELPDKPQLRLP